mgnify:CR=1 FL=1|jgi:hypothetical protein|tara:strand:- start:63 stop:572 length:510 start_codon:yes stop_codon:yes gene_type:complete
MPRQIRIIRICGDVAYVPLTQGCTAIIDAADVPLVNGRNWHARKVRNVIYASHKESIGGNWRNANLHRVIMGEPHGWQVDHIDGDGLNNRRNNLRLATFGQNSQNRRINSNNKSGFKGVCFHKHSGKWRGQIRSNYKTISLGYFASPEEAHAAYCLASEKYHGEFGRTE